MFGNMFEKFHMGNVASFFGDVDGYWDKTAKYNVSGCCFIDLQWPKGALARCHPARELQLHQRARERPNVPRSGRLWDEFLGLACFRDIYNNIQ